ncbi:SLAM family member 7-like isoform X2 [Chiloscyllium punctatum]|uniref:SLAM family member 7-like isoform X2 n=1 Tax=Chiloscyllium punctatum TaxID=137246 RepID=UPI003B6353F6
MVDGDRLSALSWVTFDLSVPPGFFSAEMGIQSECSSRFRKLYLLLFLEIQVAGLRQCEGGCPPETLVVGTLGHSVMFSSTSAETLPENVIWEVRKGDHIICNGKTKEDCSANFRGRVLLHPRNLTAELRTVQQSDEGIYQVRLGTEWRYLHRERFNLRVYEAIFQPFITMTNVSINGSCVVNLTCAVQEGSHVSYTWHQQEAALSRQPVFHDGESVQVTLSENMTLSYRCVTQNPVSVRNVTIQLHNSCQRQELMDPREDTDLQNHSMTIYAAISPRIPRPQTQQVVTVPTHSQSNTVYSVIVGHPSV